MIAEVTYVSKRKKAIPYTLAQKSFTAAELAFLGKSGITQKILKLFQGIHMVVIDGIADLIKGANDETESIAVVEELYRLAGIYNTCIVTILHFIPSGLKLRGHLGSELQRKAAAILSIEKDTDPSVSMVKALKVRDGSPLDVPIMQFA